MVRNRAHNTRQSRSQWMPNYFSTQQQMGPISSDNSVAHRTLLLQRNILLATCIILSVALLQSHWGIFSISSSPILLSKSLKKGTSANCEISLGKYRGPIYHSVESGTVGEPQCLLDSKWMRVSLHHVQFPGSDTIYDDWMWIDYHDRINVLVEDGTNGGEEPRFLVFEQTKYALEGRNSLAIIGGIIEAGEEPEAAAKREVEEEMDGLICEEFHFLGPVSYTHLTLPTKA